MCKCNCAAPPAVELDVMIRSVSNGFVLNEDEVIEFGTNSTQKQDALKRLLNRVLECVGEESWHALIEG